MSKAPFSIHAPKGPFQWVRLFLLYRRSFPRSERKPFGMILSMRRRGKTDVWYAEAGGRFAGLAATINSERLILLDYLAVPARLRGKGYGSRMLEALRMRYSGKGLFVEIENAFVPGPDLLQRQRRRQFYLKNGMISQQVMAEVFGVEMELLGWDCRVDFPAYRAFYRNNLGEFAANHVVEAAFPPESVSLPESGSLSKNSIQN